MNIPTQLLNRREFVRTSLLGGAAFASSALTTLGAEAPDKPAEITEAHGVAAGPSLHFEKPALDALHGPAFSTYNETIKNEPMIEPDESTEPDSIAATLWDAAGADNQSKPPYR